MDLKDEVTTAVSFPLPFRVLFLVGLGILGWATNLHGLELAGIDATHVLDSRNWQENHLPRKPPSRSLGFGFRLFLSDTSTLYAPVYRLFTTYFSWCFFWWCLYRYVSHLNPILADMFRYFPAVCALGVLTILFCPYDICQKRERDAFLHAIRRWLFPQKGRPIYFADVILADIFTSYAKIFGDVWLAFCMLLPGGSLFSSPPQDGWSRWVLPALMSFPYLIRIRQCLVQYNTPSNSMGKMPLFNALKYTTSFPVIFLSAAQRSIISDLVEEKGEGGAQQVWLVEHYLFRIWMLAAAVNSLYSFWWDISNDWGMDLLQHRTWKLRSQVSRPSIIPLRLSASATLPTTHVITPRHSPSHSSDVSSKSYFDTNAITQQPTNYPYGLRPDLLYPLPVYPLVIFLNLILRLTWSVKLSSHLHSTSEGSTIIFWLEMAEVFRRWMWIFIRVEWEALKTDKEERRPGMSNGNRSVELASYD